MPGWKFRDYWQDRLLPVRVPEIDVDGHRMELPGLDAPDEALPVAAPPVVGVEPVAPAEPEPPVVAPPAP